MFLSPNFRGQEAREGKAGVWSVKGLLVIVSPGTITTHLQGS